MYKGPEAGGNLEAPGTESRLGGWEPKGGGRGQRYKMWLEE